MDLRLTVDSRETLLRVFVNDRLIGEVSAGLWEGREGLELEVRQARYLMGTARILSGMLEEAHKAAEWDDHVNTKDTKRRERYGAGLVDGVLGRVVDHPMGKSVRPIPPDSDPSYLRGYQRGEAIVRAWEDGV